MNKETSHPSVLPPEEEVSGPENLMLWLFLAFFVLLAAVIFGDLFAIFLR